jgi:hypothetical protein
MFDADCPRLALVLARHDFDALRALATDEGPSMAGIVREAVVALLAGHPSPEIDDYGLLAADAPRVITRLDRDTDAALDRLAADTGIERSSLVRPHLLARLRRQ